VILRVVMSILSEPHFHNEEAAFARLEQIVWPNGTHCPRCGGFDRITRVTGGRAGLWRCGPCKRQFTVKVGTVFESSHIPLHKWFQAAHLLASSKKGISAHQLHRTLKVTYKTAWFMEHRLREAMRSGPLAPMGGAGSVIEADETYHGRKAEQPTHRTDGMPYKGSKSGRPVFGPAGKRAIVALVERGGSVRTFHVDRADKYTVAGIVSDNISREASLHTDESPLYPEIGREFVAHETVRHSADEYVRGHVHTNTVEGVFSIFKRGMKGIYQHCSSLSRGV
jgi:transposase-like protein